MSDSLLLNSENTEPYKDLFNLTVGDLFKELLATEKWHIITRIALSKGIAYEQAIIILALSLQRRVEELELSIQNREDMDYADQIRRSITGDCE